MNGLIDKECSLEFSYFSIEKCQSTHEYDSVSAFEL